jgi:hydrogenase maturation protease
VVVLGLGNVLMGDDAFGPHVIKVLEARYDFPAEVELLDGGTPGHELSTLLEGREALIVVDAVRAAGAAGELRLYDGADVAMCPPPLSVSPHEPGLKEALLKADFAGRGPREVLLVGTIPGRIDTGGGLSDAVRRAVPEAVLEVLAALSRLGYRASEKEEPGTPDLWWE